MSELVQGVTLRPLTADDANQLAQWLHDPESRGAAKGLQDDRLKRPEHWRDVAAAKSGKGVFIIADPDGRSVGLAALYNIDFERKTCHTGLAILEKTARGKKYAFTAKLLQLKFAFEGLKLESVRESVPSENKNLLEYMKKYGFEHVHDNADGTNEIEIKVSQWEGSLKHKLKQKI